MKRASVREQAQQAILDQRREQAEAARKTAEEEARAAKETADEKLEFEQDFQREVARLRDQQRREDETKEREHQRELLRLKQERLERDREFVESLDNRSSQTTQQQQPSVGQARQQANRFQQSAGVGGLFGRIQGLFSSIASRGQINNPFSGLTSGASAFSGLGRQVTIQQQQLIALRAIQTNTREQVQQQQPGQGGRGVIDTIANRAADRDAIRRQLIEQARGIAGQRGRAEGQSAAEIRDRQLRAGRLAGSRFDRGETPTARLEEAQDVVMDRVIESIRNTRAGRQIDPGKLNAAREAAEERINEERRRQNDSRQRGALTGALQQSAGQSVAPGLLQNNSRLGQNQQSLGQSVSNLDAAVNQQGSQIDQLAGQLEQLKNRTNQTRNRRRTRAINSGR